MNHTLHPEEAAEVVAAQALERMQRRIRVARGQEPGDLLLTGGLVVNVFTEQVEPANVVIADGRIAGVGPYPWQAGETIDLKGQIVMPGLIDAHMHLESTLLLPAELAKVVVPHGTAAVVADPHEVGNVLGVRGVEMLLRASENLPLDIFFMAPSCVPATSWEHAGAVLEAAEVEQLLEHERVLGLAEVMDFPAVLDGKPGVLKKVVAAQQRRAAVDGHAPGLLGQPLVAYAAAGIRSDHESTTVEEARQKGALGMLVQVREGSSARNLDALLPLLVENKLGDWCLATDDIHPDDLVARGHLDGLLRRIVQAGVPLGRAVRHASLVPARHYGLVNRGAVAPSYRADLLVVNNAAELRPSWVIHGGRIVARDGEYLADVQPAEIPPENTVHLGPIRADDFELKITGRQCPIIQALPNQIVTQAATGEAPARDGRWVFDPAHDLALVASIERHRASGQIGLGLVRGLHLRKGALGSSVAHDSHNLIVAGTNAEDMLACVNDLQQTGGGFVVAAEGKVLARLPLPVAGLLSRHSAEQVCAELEQLHAAARELGCTLESPFGTLSFLALSVIPELRITDQGLFDVVKQQFVNVG